MYSHPHYFVFNKIVLAVTLPFDINDIIAEWNRLRPVMMKKMPREFSRDEWAYLITFLEKDNLLLPFRQSFGEQKKVYGGAIEYLIKPRGLIALWLPNNVSLLGPLMLILLSLTGNPVCIKGGSKSENLIGAFLNFSIENLSGDILKTYLKEKVKLEFFDRNDSRHREMAGDAAIRIAFGSDQAAKTIESLPHPINSIGIYFIDKQSEAWVEEKALSETTLEALIKIFAIYGQAGCTSPKKVVIINGTRKAAVNLRNRLARFWPKIIKRLPPASIASSNVMAWQWATVLGWDAKIVENNAAVLAAGKPSLPMFSSPMSFPIVWATVEEALKGLPDNIQTLGYAFDDLRLENWVKAVASSQVKRFVPIESMHHFGHVWDGYAFWQQLFEKVSFQLNHQR